MGNLTPHERSTMLRGALFVGGMILGAVVLYSVFLAFEYSGLGGQ
jgi:hypothetical protein